MPPRRGSTNVTRRGLPWGFRWEDRPDSIPSGWRGDASAGEPRRSATGPRGISASALCEWATTIRTRSRTAARRMRSGPEISTSWGHSSQNGSSGTFPDHTPWRARSAAGSGDNVKIVRSALTSALGYADKTGVCHGFTTPPVTGVEVVGDLDTADIAFAVHFGDDGMDEVWFSPDLVEIVDHAPGIRATVGNGEFVKADDGSWLSIPPGGKRTRLRKWFRHE